MKELLNIDQNLRRIHKFKCILPNAKKLPDYLIVKEENPDFYVQFDNEGMKIYSLNSKSIDINLPIIPVVLDKEDHITVTLKTSEIEHFTKALRKSYDSSDKNNYNIILDKFNNPLFLKRKDKQSLWKRISNYFKF